MPRPADILGGLGRKRARPVYLVGRYPERVVRGVALSDGMDGNPGVSYFEVLDTHRKADGMWLKLENMELRQGGEFHIRDCAELRIVGNAARLREERKWA